jgi:hypothetical protein
MESLMTERRLVVRLRKYWDFLRGEDNLPNYAKFNKSAIDDVLQSCILCSVAHSGKSMMFKYEYLGKDAVDAFGIDLTGQYAANTDRRIPGVNFLKFMTKAIESKDFTSAQGQFVNDNNKIVKYRDCILPFLDSHGNIAYLVVGLSWRSFD